MLEPTEPSRILFEPKPKNIPASNSENFCFKLFIIVPNFYKTIGADTQIVLIDWLIDW